MDIALDEVVHFDAITSSVSTGAAADADSTPTWSIFEEDNDTAILSAQNFTKRTSLTGNYRGSATLSAANGFEVGKWYNVIASATVGGVAGKAVVMRFRVVPAEAVAGTPKVDTTHAAGTAWNSGAIGSNTLASDTITAAKIADGAIDAATFAADVDAEILSYLVDDATRIDASALNTASGAVGSDGSGLTEAGGTGDHLTAVPWSASWDTEVQSEVEDALLAYGLVLNRTTIATLSDQQNFTLTAGSADDDAYTHGIAVILDQSTAVQKSYVRISDYVGSTRSVTLAALPAFTIATGDTVVILPGVGSADIASISLTVSTINTKLGGITGLSDTVHERLPSALVSGRMNSSIGNMEANTLSASAIQSGAFTAIKFADGFLTADKVADGAIDAAAFASGALDAVWSTAARTLTAIDEDSTTLDLDAAIRAALGMASADLDTQLDAIKSDTAAILVDTGTDGVVVATGSKTGYALSATGLDLVVPADPSAIPVLGTSSIVAWIAYFGAWSVNEVNSDSDSVNLRNSADNADLATHVTSDDGSTFSSGEAS